MKVFQITYGYLLIMTIMNLIGRIILPEATLFMELFVIITALTIFKVDSIEDSNHLLSFSIDFRLFPVAKSKTE